MDKYDEETEDPFLSDIDNYLRDKDGKNEHKLRGNLRKRFPQREHCARVSVEAIAKRWKVSERRVRQLCQKGIIFSAMKVNGEWTIPEDAEKPVDCRRYGHKRIPGHLKPLIMFADRAVREAKAELTSGRNKRHLIDGRNPYEFFMVGSAYHLHKRSPSSLNLEDVKKILAGKAVGGKRLTDQIAVQNHFRALDYVFQQVMYRHRISAKMICELHAILAYGSESAADDRDEDDLRIIVSHTLQSRATPIVTAAGFMAWFMAKRPFTEQLERTAYMVVNFILLSGGYPPIIIYRAMIRAYYVYWWQRAYFIPREARQHYVKQLDPSFFAKSIACAVRYSCRIGLAAANPLLTPELLEDLLDRRSYKPGPDELG